MGVVVTANRTQISDCEATTNWAGGTIATNDAFNLEGTFCLGEKVSQTTGSENMYTFPGPDPDMTDDFIVIPMQVTGTPDTIANGGFRILVEDVNTDRGTWYVGGSDTTNEKWSYFVVDPSTAPTYLNGTLNSAKAVTSITRSGTTATCTTTAVHGLATGDYVVVKGADPEQYNGSYPITVLTTAAFTYGPMSSDPGASCNNPGSVDLRQGVDFTEVDKVGVQFKVLSKSVGNTPNALWDICWYGQGLQVTSTIDSVTLTRSGSTVTVASTGHGLVVGQKVRIAGATQTDYNGDWTIATVPGANSYTYDIGGATPTTPATGTITSRVHATWQDIADASAAGFWGLVVQTQGVNYIQGRFIFGSSGAAADLLFVDEAFKVIFRENAFLPFVSNNLLPAKFASGDQIDIEWSNGLISAFNTEWAWDFFLSPTYAPDTIDIDGVTFEGARIFNCDADSSHTYTNVTWNNVRLIDPQTSTVSNSAVRNSPPDGLGILWPGTSNNVSDMVFSNNVYGVTITQTTDQTFDNFVFEDVSNQYDVLLANGGTDISVSNINGSNANTYLSFPSGVVTFIDQPVTTKLTVTDNQGTVIENARCFLETSDAGTGGSGLPFEQSVLTLTRVSTTATLTANAAHGLATGDYVVVRGASDEYYNKQAQITVTSTVAFTYTVNASAAASAGGTPVFSYCPISGLTSALGVISSSKVWPVAQGVKGWARKSSANVKQTEINISDASGGTDLLVALQPDI